jgi:hypothetical protein
MVFPDTGHFLLLTAPPLSGTLPFALATERPSDAMDAPGLPLVLGWTILVAAWPRAGSRRI